MPVLQDKAKRQQLRRDLYQRLESGESIARTVKDLRAILSMDQSQFSQYIGVSVSTLRKIEQEKGNYSVVILNRILEKFSLEIVLKLKKK